PQVHGFFSVPVDHLTAIGALADHFRERDLSDCVVVSPDLGNAKQATLFARLLGLPVAAGSKQRLADDKVVIDAIVGDVAGKRAIVIDDEIATGGSIIELLDKLTEAGCPDAAVACTHGLFAGRAVERLTNHPMITEVVTTDTVPRPDDFPGLKVRSVSRLFAEAIARIHVGESVSSLFDGVDPAHASPQRQLPLYDGYEGFDMLEVLDDPRTARGAPGSSGRRIGPANGHEQHSSGQAVENPAEVVP
ncbi:MAG: ribose-phosphate diphosphokinase, partial [Austwickia sp.]|nr:ribose-phosphate diphosphokinase [Austwickia sp.]